MSLGWANCGHNHSGKLRYVLFTDEDYLYLETLDIISFQIAKKGETHHMTTVYDMGEFTKTVDNSRKDYNHNIGGANIPMYGNGIDMLNRVINTGNDYIRKDFVYFNLENVILE